jgi:ABC transport system ATP-binding/permease protein
MSEDRRCPHCGARLGPRDRVCFYCQRATEPVPPRMAQPGRAGPPRSGTGTRGQAASATVPPGWPAAHPQQRPAPGPVSPLQIELVWGRDHRLVSVPASGATIGSTAEADVVVSAAFLAPRHARVVPGDGFWMVECVAPAGRVLLHGRPVRHAPLAPGDVFRLADGVGNFVTVRVSQDAGKTRREGALRAALPGPDESYLIGSAPRCRVRLDHPLIQPRHVAVRRDSAGTLWLDDRGTAAGTYLNGHRLRGQARVSIGDILQVGPYNARVGPAAFEPLEQVAGVDIRVHDARVDAPRARNGRARTLLNHVSLRLAPASMTAVAGPSGAGKTTLMRLLSGQLAAADGQVSYNGVDLAECRQAYAALMGYVPQEDIVHADLTVHEALGYQAGLRLGRRSPAATREARVEHVLTLMGLLEQRNQLVKTLSGGQRKRVSIACELLNEPQILFLDEPTSGLDPGLDKRMMLLLRLLADQGRTVVLTTHAIAHVDVCDTLVLVGPGGHVIYSDDPDSAPSWFGVPTLSDIFSVVDSPEAAAQAARRASLAQQADGSGPGPAVPRGPVAPGSSAQSAPGAPPAGRDGALGGARPPAGSAAWRRAVADQARIFAGRYVRLVGRDRAALAFSLLQGVAVAMLTALAVPKPFSWELGGNAPMFVFGCAAVWFGMIGAVRELVKEKTIWHREFLAGGDIAAYLASKVLVLGALAAFQALTLTVAAGLTLGLPAGGPLGHPFGTVFVTLWLAILSGMALGLLVSAASASADRAMSLVPYLLITQLVLCGVLFRLGAVTFVSWIMPARWSVSALGGIAGLSAEQLHQTSGLYPHSAAGLMSNWLVLLVLAASGLAGTAWLLYRQGRSWSVGSDPAQRPGLLSPAAALGGQPQAGVLPGTGVQPGAGGV